MINRSYLYVPANRPDMVVRAADRGADAVIIDLEDSVPQQEKPSARTAAVAAVASISSTGLCEVWVRVNAGADMATDLDAVAIGGLAGVMIPKADTDAVMAASRMLTGIEQRKGLDPGSIGIIPLIETAAGVIDARTVAAAAARVRRLGLGEADLAGDLGANLGDDAFRIIRMQVVLASGAAGIEPPIGPTSLELADMDVVATTTQELRSLGFLGRTAIHPRQIDPINTVFTPTTSEIESARRIIHGLALAMEGGTAATEGDGSFIDPAVARRAQATLDLADRATARGVTSL